MAYTAVNYREFAPYKVERVAGYGVKKITWDNIVTQREVDSFQSRLIDERTKVILQTQICMPFDVYIIPAEEAWCWSEYVRSQKQLQQIFNCVYLLWGHDFICAGKSVNGDIILGQIEDESKIGFDYQMLFVPNNDNPATMANWTSDFMAYLESELIDRIKADNQYCQNAIAGKNVQKSQRDLNLNADKEEFAANIIDLIVEVFKDLSYCSYLIPEEKEPLPFGNEPKGNDDSMLDFWNKILRVSDYESQFRKLVKPQKGKAVYLNMNSAKLIANATLQCVVTQATCRVELVGWGDRSSAQKNLENYDTLWKNKEQIEDELGCQLRWNRKDGKYTTNISFLKSLRYTDASNGNIRDIADFFCEYFDKFYTVFPKYCDFSPEDVETFDIDS
ncbi:MAG: DUF4268 domain-containing protein [Bacteroidales bacterium]|nr:DUF4268 domain-containing protein [Candidatus Liminaster caballi]